LEDEDEDEYESVSGDMEENEKVAISDLGGLMLVKCVYAGTRFKVCVRI